MENEEIVETEQEEYETTLRKYAASPIAGFLAIIVAYIVWEYTFTSWNFLACAIVFCLTIFSGLFPIRTRSHFVINEFYIDDFTFVFGLFLLDPFQLGLAFTLGGLVFHIIAKYSIKRQFSNLYSNFIVAAIPATIIQAPVDIDSSFFPLIMLGALLLIYVVDTIMFYLVCRYKISENLSNIISPFELAALTFGLVLGIPTCIIIDSKPAYAVIMFLLFVSLVVAANIHSKTVTRKEQLEQILNFMKDTVDTKTMRQSEIRFIEMTKSAFKHDRISVRMTEPDQKNEIGHILYSDEKGDHWLVVNRPDVSKKRVSHDHELLLDILQTAQRAFEYRALQEKLFKAARHDSLTDLANRSTLEEYVEHELGLVKRNKTEFSLMFIDLDKFKPVNDIYGHKAGDELLRCIARRLELTIRTQDVVARIGGDEFVILCRDISAKEACDLAKRIEQEVLKPVFIDDSMNHESIERLGLVVGASIGVSSAPVDGITFEKLLKVADTRMYKAKKINEKTRTIQFDKNKTKTA